jgi:hypothetical protein
MYTYTYTYTGGTLHEHELPVEFVTRNPEDSACRRSRARKIVRRIARAINNACSVIRGEFIRGIHLSLSVSVLLSCFFFFFFFPPPPIRSIPRTDDGLSSGRRPDKFICHYWRSKGQPAAYVYARYRSRRACEDTFLLSAVGHRTVERARRESESAKIGRETRKKRSTTSVQSTEPAG